MTQSDIRALWMPRPPQRFSKAVAPGAPCASGSSTALAGAVKALERTREKKRHDVTACHHSLLQGLGQTVYLHPQRQKGATPATSAESRKASIESES